MLSLVLVLTAQSMAIARGANTGATDQIVICSGGASVTVYVDETGTPVDPPHICPDCMLHLLGAVLTHDPVAWVPDRTLRVALVAASSEAILRTPRMPIRVRGPPMTV